MAQLNLVYLIPAVPVLIPYFPWQIRLRSLFPYAVFPQESIHISTLSLLHQVSIAHFMHIVCTNEVHCTYKYCISNGY